MKCVIYKGAHRADTFLFIERELDFAKVPTKLLAALGTLEKVMSLELFPGRTLAGADPVTVRQQLRDTGFYLQLPPTESDITF